MSWISAAAVYFIMWWLVLFVVLPFGVRNAHEARDAVVDGNDAGAPVSHGMVWKTAVTTGVTTVVFGLFYLLVTSGFLQSLELPFLPRI